VPVIRCISLNYMKHIQGGRTPPPYLSIFLKARTSVASYDEDVPVPKLAQDDQCDYEGELSIVIGKTGKNIKEEEALDYVAGYVSSNDISSRKVAARSCSKFARDV
jgi:2-keto-4-pentenoate hydratase/2-oxohepta-3-ene-1,7-dioic acid hydratase in catechol pathway